jgi:hypothetical protein
MLPKDFTPDVIDDPTRPDPVELIPPSTPEVPEPGDPREKLMPSPADSRPGSDADPTPGDGPSAPRRQPVPILEERPGG